MYRKLGRTNKHRRSMLANLTKDVIMNEKIETTETRAKEARKFVDKMISYGKDGSLVKFASILLLCLLVRPNFLYILNPPNYF